MNYVANIDPSPFSLYAYFFTVKFERTTPVKDIFRSKLSTLSLKILFIAGVTGREENYVKRKRGLTLRCVWKCRRGNVNIIYFEVNLYKNHK